MRILPTAPAYALSRISHAQLLCAFAIGALVTGCGTASGPGSFTTASLPPRPVEGMVQQPRTGYAPAATLGAPMTRTGPRAGQVYQWNGNRERVQVGSAAPASAQMATPRIEPTPASLTWKASPRAPGPSDSKASTQAAATSRDIIVGPGDTVFSIASQHNVSMSSLMQVNHLTSPELKVSQHLVLPAAVR